MPAVIAAIYRTLLTSKRRRESSASKGRNLALEAASDKGRVLFSASFRRLQSKTQAFPQEWNAAVRTRLTHSLEVASVGRYLAQGIADELLAKGHFGEVAPDLAAHDMASGLVTFVEVACLMHDLGNPPFGHFGEASICEWFAKSQVRFAEKFQNVPHEFAQFNMHYKDFLHFDGNAQGFRMATRLQWVNDEFGYNLTYTQLAAMLKYPWTPGMIGQKKDGNEVKKPGAFFTEAAILADVQAALSIKPGARHPLAYVMEAADDISYCLSDIEDAIEKKVVTNDEVIAALREPLSKLKSRHARAMVGALPSTSADDSSWFVGFRTSVTNELVERARLLYLKYHDDVLNGGYFSLLDRTSTAKTLLKVVRDFSEKKLYTSQVVRERELVGFQVLSGILDKFGFLLQLTSQEAIALLCEKKVPKTSGFALAATLRSFLPEKHLKVYQHAVTMLGSPIEGKTQFVLEEWMARAHLIVDYVSGMTDDFAIVMYRRLYGGGTHSL